MSLPIKLYGFDWDYLYKFDIVNMMELRAFQKMIENSENLKDELRTNLKDYIKSIQDDNQIREDAKQHLIVDYQSKEDWVISDIAKWSKYSICLSMYSFFESRLKELCDEIDKKFGFKLSVKDLKNDEDIKRYMAYLTKVFHMEVPDAASFSILKEHKKIRNSIAHSNGEAIEGFSIQKSIGLNVEYDRFKLSKKYLVFILKTMGEALNELPQKVDARYNYLKLS